MAQGCVLQFCLRVARLRVARLRVAILHVARLRVAILHVALCSSGKTLAYLLPSLVHCHAQPRVEPGHGPIVSDRPHGSLQATLASTGPAAALALWSWRNMLRCHVATCCDVSHRSATPHSRVRRIGPTGSTLVPLSSRTDPYHNQDQHRSTMPPVAPNAPSELAWHMPCQIAHCKGWQASRLR